MGGRRVTSHGLGAAWLRRGPRTAGAVRPGLLMALLLTVVVAAVVAVALSTGERGDAPRPARIDAYEAGALSVYADLNRVVDIEVATDGQVWAATRGGVAHRHDGSWEAYTIEDGLAHNDATAVAVAADGSAWVGTTGGLSRIGPERDTVDDGGSDLDGEHVQAVAVGPDGELWVAAAGGVARFDGRGWTRHDRGPRSGGGRRRCRVGGDVDSAQRRPLRR